MTFNLNKHKQLMRFVSLSVVAHIILLFLVSYQVGEHQLKKTIKFKESQTKPTPRIIQAQLIYQKDVIKSQKPKQPVDEKFVNNKPEQAAQAKTAKALNYKEKKPFTPQPQQEQAVSNQQKSARSASAAEIMAASKKYFSKIPEPPPFNPPFSDGSTSIIAINNNVRTVPQHHKSIDSSSTMGAPKPTKVLCDNTLGVATAIMSGLTGGTVQCESLPDVSEFLKKRNKEKNNR